MISLCLLRDVFLGVLLGTGFLWTPEAHHMTVTEPLLYGKSGLSGTLEVLSNGTPYCDGATGYVVREVGQTPTFDVATKDTSFSVGQTFVVGVLLGTPPCGALPKKYNFGQD